MIRIKNAESAVIEGKSLSARYDVKLLLETDIGDVWPVFDTEEYKPYSNVVVLSDYIYAKTGTANWYDMSPEAIIKFAQEVMYEELGR